jgi:hypothetical protein
MEDWTLYVPAFCWIVLILINVFLTFIGYLSVKSMLRGTAADALRPYTPKKMKSLKMESWGCGTGCLSAQNGTCGTPSATNPEHL